MLLFNSVRKNNFKVLQFFTQQILRPLTKHG